MGTKKKTHLTFMFNFIGVMAGRGILSNPSLFDGTNKTTENVIQEWVNICNAKGNNVSFQTYHHHLVFMLEKVLPKRVRSVFNSLSTKTAVTESLADLFGIIPQPINSSNKVDCYFEDSYYKGQTNKVCDKCCKVKQNCSCLKFIYDSSENGKYFYDACDDDDSDGDMYLGNTLFDQ